MSAPQLDELDRQLIALLARDARVSNRKIAAELNVTEGTVRGRIRRLQQDGLIAFTAITGYGVAEKTRLAFINILAEPGRLRAVSQEIAAWPEVNAVLITTGPFNLVAMCLFGELDEVFALASDRIVAIPGVQQVETSVAVRTLSYNAGISRITAERQAEELGQGNDA
ncbi:MAG TPA: Lrp/AsnC family transcriptional regulator [Novosphingobium sp.]|nr:Lrp/AsnC family transcriptional regulator [Novosphingobium sp.]